MSEAKTPPAATGAQAPAASAPSKLEQLSVLLDQSIAKVVAETATAERERAANPPRLFVGLPVPVEVASQLARAADGIAKRLAAAGAQGGPIRARWVAPLNYHLTLCFLGFTRPEAIEAVKDAIAKAASAAPFRWKPTGLGAFPSVEDASVIWAGVEEPTGALAALQGRVVAACAELGFAIDPRPFHPHITLGRLLNSRPLGDVLRVDPQHLFSECSADQVILYESSLKSNSSAYGERAKIPLKTTEKTPETSDRRQSPPLDLAASTQAIDTSETDDGWPRDHTG